jgi:hypothetical protein
LLKVNEMKQGFDIAAMVEELEPVKPICLSHGAVAIGIMLALAAGLIVMTTGMRPDLQSGEFHQMFLLRGGLLLLLGVGCGWAVLSMARPSIGKQGQSWKMAIAAAAILPFAALIVAMTGRVDVAMDNMRFGLDCMLFSTLGGLATAIPMVLQLRRGAPTSLERAGWLTGFAAGGFGTFAYGLHCPFNDMVYIGLWYSLAVGVCAVLGRLVVPRLIRW